MTFRSIGVSLLLLSYATSVCRAQIKEQSAEVSKSGNTWLIAGKSTSVHFDESSFAVKVDAGGRTWSMLPSTTDDLVVKTDEDVAKLGFTTAKQKEVNSYRTGFESGIKVRISGFGKNDAPLDLVLTLLICLDSADELVFTIVAEERTAKIQQCTWPKPIDPAAVDATVIPYMQGVLLPRTWPKRVELYDTMCYSRGLYMPWWGHQKDHAAAIVILETPQDAGCTFEHPPGGPTRIGVRWVHSLGKLAYPRRARISFFDTGNYVDLAKRYRRYAVETGNFVSLKQKVARTPSLEKLIGCPVIHTSILYHIQPDSSYFNRKDPAINHNLVPFDARAAQLRALAARGVKKAYVHLDGWGTRGYDNLHPDVLPPCPEAGGWDGMRRFSQTCAALEYTFALHDNYHDYYHDARSFDPKLAITNEQGDVPLLHVWFGGEQAILCAHFAAGHVAKNHRELLAQDVKLGGTYIDEFSIIPPEECYNPDHLMTRRECLSLRGRCFELVRALEGVVSSEEPADWAIPYLDLVHHAPFALDPSPARGIAVGFPVPLFSLVYHDALMVPWFLDKGGFGIPSNDSAYLYGMANGGMPYLSITPEESELRRVRKMAALHSRVAMLEMTRHEFLDKQCRRQQTTFDDGTTVTIDLDNNSVDVKPPLPIDN